mmetsp:Transcript_56223/g.98169  ORF Transcript_56223/g.98169 Transcript_56223/m.98169 type:complete len:240 (-) Transcript_56223:125-844(-)
MSSFCGASLSLDDDSSCLLWGSRSFLTASASLSLSSRLPGLLGPLSAWRGSSCLRASLSLLSRSCLGCESSLSLSCLELSSSRRPFRLSSSLFDSSILSPSLRASSLRASSLSSLPPREPPLPRRSGLAPFLSSRRSSFRRRSGLASSLRLSLPRRSGLASVLSSLRGSFLRRSGLSSYLRFLLSSSALSFLRGSDSSLRRRSPAGLSRQRFLSSSRRRRRSSEGSRSSSRRRRVSPSR